MSDKPKDGFFLLLRMLGWRLGNKKQSSVYKYATSTHGSFTAPSLEKAPPLKLSGIFAQSAKLSHFWAILALFSCATPPPADEIAAFENSGNLETLVILGTNDIHGALAPAQLKSRDATPIDYEKGGAALFASHVSILRRQYGEHLLLLDAGDQFQGSIDSNLEEGRPMIQFFNQLGYTAAAIGNHEFDFGPVGSRGAHNPEASAGSDLRGTLKARIAEARYPYLAANVYDRKSGGFPGVPGTRASTLVKVGRLKVGIVGLTTLGTPTSTRPTFVNDLEFRPMPSIAIAESKKLRAEGADIVLLVTHAGVFCNIPVAADRGTRSGLIKTEADFQTGCASDQEVPELLRKIPKGTFDAVVSGHTHSLVHHWIEGVPVIQAGTQGVYYNLIYLTYDWTQKRLRADKTRIEGPIPICEKIFANQKNCNGEAPAPPQGRGNLVRPKLRGVEVQKDPAMKATLASTFQNTAQKKAEVVGLAARPLSHTREAESMLGNLVADAIRDALGTDAAIMNPGGVRAGWEAGPIHYEHVFRTLPFDNFLSKLTLTGKELRNFVRITHSGARGFYSTSGLRVRAIRREDEPYSGDLDGNKKTEPWELDRVLEVKFADGREIEDGKMYTVGTIDFLVDGGDSLGWFMSSLPKDRMIPMAGPVLRDSVVAHLKKLGAAHPAGINAEAAPLVNPSEPRLILEPRPAGKAKTAVRSRRQKSRAKRSN